MVERLPYKEEVAGSNPASPTYKLPANELILWVKSEARGALPGLFTATILQPEQNSAHDTVLNAASMAWAAESCISGKTWE